MAIGDTAVQANTDLAQQWGPDGDHAASGDQRWYPILYPGIDYLLVNPTSKTTSDPVVRQAIALALDRGAAAQSYFEPAAVSILNASVPIQDPAVTALIGPDAATAHANLAGKTATVRMAVQQGCDQCLDSANSIKSNLAAAGLTLDLVQEGNPIEAAADPTNKIDLIAPYVQQDYPDSAALLNEMVDTAPKGWLSDSVVAQAKSLLSLAGTARNQAAADLAHVLTTDATVIPYGESIDGVYFSPKVGCRTIVGGVINVDLVALCPAVN
jgi:ABC-type oligopeptide transport system substrate-binding subunit